MYNKIYEFCKVKNLGTVIENTDEPTPRVKFLMNLLDSMNIDYELDKFKTSRFRSEIWCYNLILRGNSNRMVIAHHDIVNPNCDNANDNSASVINAIMVKKLIPNMNVVIVDGEEMGGIGSTHLGEQIKNGDFGSIEWVLNLELTGKGGKRFFIGNYPGNLFNRIKTMFDCPIVNTPFNDSIRLRALGIDSCVINPLPVSEFDSNVKWSDGTNLDSSILWHCHTMDDSLDNISVDDMKEFVEEVLIPILS